MHMQCEQCALLALTKQLVLLHASAQMVDNFYTRYQISKEIESSTFCNGRFGE